MMLARDIMNKDVIVIKDMAKIYELTKLLMNLKISIVPVCNGAGDMVGIVSEKDLLGLKDGERVKDIMKQVISVSAETPVKEVAGILSSYEISMVPVIEDGQLVGIISRSDIVAAVARGNILNPEVLM